MNPDPLAVCVGAESQNRPERRLLDWRLSDRQGGIELGHGFSHRILEAGELGRDLTRPDALKSTHDNFIVDKLGRIRVTPNPTHIGDDRHPGIPEDLPMPVLYHRHRG